MRPAKRLIRDYWKFPNRSVSFEKVREVYQSNNMLEGLRASILEEKVMDFLIEKAKIEEALGKKNQIDNKS